MPRKFWKRVPVGLIDQKLSAVIRNVIFGILIATILLPCAKILSSAQYASLAPCPRVYGIPNFNITKYEGKWFEVEKYWFIVEATTRCLSVEYLDSKDGTFAVEINQIEGVSGKTWVNPGVTRYLSKDGSGNFILDLLVTQSPVPFRFKYPYLVLDTDYTSYTIKYRCKQIGVMSIQTMWILSRNRTFTPETRRTVHTSLRRLGIDTTRLTQSDQTSCPPS